MATDFEVKGELGRGAFGIVYLIEKKDTQEKLALKTVDISRSSETERKSAKDEAILLSRLDSPHVVSYVNSYTIGKTLFIITEFCENGDLGRFMENCDSPLPEDLIVCWTSQITMALVYLHENGVLHRDLKPQNIYLTGDGDVKVGDLGIARALEEPDALAQTMAGTPCYMSPEIIQRRPYNSKSDIWSFGCLVYEMAASERAFGGGPPIMLFLILRVLTSEVPSIPSWYSQEMQQLVHKMLSKEPDARPSAIELLGMSPIKEFGDKPRPPIEIMKNARGCIMASAKERLKPAEKLDFGRKDVQIPMDTLELFRQRMKRQHLSSTASYSGSTQTSEENGRYSGQSGSTLTETTVFQDYNTIIGKLHKPKNKVGPTKNIPNLNHPKSPSPGKEKLVPKLQKLYSEDTATREVPDGVEMDEETVQDRLLRQIEILQKQCAEGVGASNLSEAYNIMSQVKNPALLKVKLLELLGQEKFIAFGHKIMYLRLFEYGLDKMTR